jgi:hypothetical protein
VSTTPLREVVGSRGDGPPPLPPPCASWRWVAGRVTLTYQPVAQDGLGYQALDVTIEGIPAAQPDPQPAGPGYHSHLTAAPD